MTRGSNQHPTRRLVGNRHGDEYVVELGFDHIIPPKRTRRGGRAEIVALPGLVYMAALRKKLEVEKGSSRVRRR